MGLKRTMQVPQEPIHFQESNKGQDFSWAFTDTSWIYFSKTSRLPGVRETTSTYPTRTPNYFESSGWTGQDVPPSVIWKPLNLLWPLRHTVIHSCSCYCRICYKKKNQKLESNAYGYNPRPGSILKLLMVHGAGWGGSSGVGRGLHW